MAVRSLFEILIQSSKPGEETTLTCDECFVVMEYFVELALEGFTLEEIKKRSSNISITAPTAVSTI